MTGRAGRVVAAVAAGVTVGAIGVLIGTQLAGPLVVEGYVVGLNSSGVVCVVADAPDPTDPLIGHGDGLIGAATARRGASTCRMSGTET